MISRIRIPRMMMSSILMVALGLLVMGSSGEAHATASTLTLTIDSSTVKVDVAPSGHNGTFSKTTGSTVTASTDNATGYTLSISAPTSAGSDYDKLINTTDNTAMLNSISTPLTEEQYKASENTSYNNTWGYLPSKYCSDRTSDSCADNASFLPAPTTAGDILDQTTSANLTANTYTIGMGTRIDYDTKPGSYSNSYVVKLVANAVPYTITYNANGGTGAPANVNSSTFAETVALSTTTPTKTNYNFNGWCTVSPTTTAGVDACTGGTTYAAGSNWTLDQTSTTNALTLFAMWSLKSYNITVNFAGSGVTGVSLSNSTYGGGGNVTTSGGTVSLKHGVAYDISGTYNSGYEFSSWATAANGALGSTSAASTTYTVTGTSTLALTGKSKLYMQNMAASNCTTTVKTVYDNRDETAYHVQRLADGKCWMLDNLALNLVAKKSVLTQNNTHASNTTLNYLKGTSTRNPSTDPNGKYATAGVSNWGSSNSYSAPLVNMSNEDVIPSDSTSQAGQYKVGGYYNYCAASAGSYCYGNGTSQGTSSGNATEDICPKGWRMPTGDTGGEYQVLYNNASYNTYAKYRSALRLPLSGFFYSGSALDQRSDGFWWSSTRSDIYPADYVMYILFADTSAICPDGCRSDRDRGNSVRCVLGS